MLFFYSLFFIDVVNQYPACYTSIPCNGFRIASLNNITLYTEHKHHMWLVNVVLQPLSCHSISVLVGCLSLIIWSQTMQSLFCQKNIDKWENVVCACRNVNQSLFSVAPCLYQLSHVLFGCTGATLEQCCPCLVLHVLSGEQGGDKVHLLLSEVLPDSCSHTLHNTESPVYSLSSLLIPFIFLTWGMRARQNKRMPLKGFLVFHPGVTCTPVIEGGVGGGYHIAISYSWGTQSQQNGQNQSCRCWDF